MKDGEKQIYSVPSDFTLETLRLGYACLQNDVLVAARNAVTQKIGQVVDQEMVETLAPELAEGAASLLEPMFSMAKEIVTLREEISRLNNRVIIVEPNPDLVSLSPEEYNRRINEGSLKSPANALSETMPVNVGGGTYDELHDSLDYTLGSKDFLFGNAKTLLADLVRQLESKGLDPTIAQEMADLLDKQSDEIYSKRDELMHYLWNTEHPSDPAVNSEKDTQIIVKKEIVAPIPQKDIYQQILDGDTMPAWVLKNLQSMSVESLIQSSETQLNNPYKKEVDRDDIRKQISVYTAIRDNPDKYPKAKEMMEARKVGRQFDIKIED